MSALRFARHPLVDRRPVVTYTAATPVGRYEIQYILQRWWLAFRPTDSILTRRVGNFSTRREAIHAAEGDYESQEGETDMGAQVFTHRPRGIAQSGVGSPTGRPHIAGRLRWSRP